MTSTEAQTRILSHMNQSHRLAIEDYLAVYGDVIINDNIVNIKMKSIDLDHLEISFNHMDIEFEIVKPIQIDPPMKTFGEARERLVEMAKTAAKKRGFSHIQIQEMIYPSKPWEFLLITLVAICVLGAIYPHFTYDYFLNYILPGPLAWTLRKFNKLIAFTAFVLHLLELQFVLMPKLKFYRVPTDFKIEWVLFCLLDGRATILRFDKVIKAETGGKH